MKKTKNNKKLLEAIDVSKIYEPIEAIKILKDNKYTKFNETLEVAINLGIDPNKTDQGIRGVTSLPKGTGKSIKVAVITKGDKQAEAKEAGAFATNYGSVFIEYNMGPLSVGVDYVPMQIETPQNKNIQGSSTNTVMAEFENLTTVYAMIPVPLGGFYIKGGWIYVDINSVETLQTGGSYGNTDTTGFTAGIGWNQEVENGFSIRAEVLAAEYDDISLTNSNNTTIKVSTEDMMGASAKISLVKSF